MSGFMRFTRSSRLSKPQEFQSVFKSQRRSGDKLLQIVARENSKNTSRLGVVVSKKHLKRAIDRNRAKRIIRESFRGAKASLTGLDIVVVLRGANKGLEKKQIRQALEKHWKKISLCKNSC